MTLPTEWFTNDLVTTDPVFTSGAAYGVGSGQLYEFQGTLFWRGANHFPKEHGALAPPALT